MSDDETPAGPHDGAGSVPPWMRPPSSESPAADGLPSGPELRPPAPADPGEVRVGVRAAAILFGFIAAAHLLTLAVVKLLGGEQTWIIFLPEGLAALVAIVVGFIYGMTKLPERSRVAFFFATVIFAALTTLLWAFTCATAM